MKSQQFYLIFFAILSYSAFGQSRQESWPNGKLKLKESADGKTEEYYESGKLKSKYQYKCSSPGGPCKFEGTYVTYYDNGQLEDSLTFNNGCPIGTHIRYYKNGNLKEYQTYLFAEYYDCSNFMRGFTLDFDYRHNNKPPRTGEYHYNWPNSKTREEGEFKEGRRTGYWYFAFSDEETSNYTMENYNAAGKKDGEQERWSVDAKGNLYKSMVEVYENGRLKEEIYYDANNTVTKRVPH